MPALVSRRLPGVYFESRSVQPDTALPRMDIAAFVGFAASGPLHTPVAVEDTAQFHAIFGEAAALAWDPLRGEFVETRLAPAVDAFFANGGTRCWIVRVAGDAAVSNHFPLPGLLILPPKPRADAPQAAFPAFARARALGSWSDGLRVQAAGSFVPIQLEQADPEGLQWQLSPASARPAVGDLLRMAFGTGGVLMFAAVAQSVTSLAGPGMPSTTVITRGPSVWFSRQAPARLPDGVQDIQVVLFSSQTTVPRDPSAIGPSEVGVPHPFEQRVPGRLDLGPLQPDATPGAVTVEIALSLEELPLAGSLLALEIAPGQRLWLVVEQLGFGAADPASGQRLLQVTGSAWWPLPGPPGALPALDQAAIVSMDLRVQDGDLARYTLRTLGFTPAHPRCWNAVPSDDAYYTTFSIPGAVPEPLGSGLDAGLEASEAGRAALRFPLAGAENADALTIPLGLGSTFGSALPAVRQVAAALERDGLATFDAALFLDPEMQDTRVEQIQTQADFIRYFRSAPRPLRGIHAVLGLGDLATLDEISMVAVPDAGHVAWHPVAPAPTPSIPTIPPIVRPDWWHALPCDPAPSFPAVAEPPTDQFLDCDLRSVAAPVFAGPVVPDASGTVTLAWLAVEPGTFTLEEASQPDFSDAAPLYVGLESTCTLYSRSPGEYFYRVRVTVGRNGSDWSAGLAVRVGGDSHWHVDDLATFDDDTLTSVHCALLRLCAGTGQLAALLSLPVHYREADGIAHAGRLRGLTPDTRGSRTAPLLGAGEADALSYGALYHPWIIQRRDDGTLAQIPPDGLISGTWALRANDRGAWVAPANEPLVGALDLTAGASLDRRQVLQDAQVNMLWQAPRGFLAWSEDTLALDDDVRPVNVRRLLILLRRIALRDGATYVFEPLGDRFQRVVQRGFETTLQELFRRGAFAGSTPDNSFQVRVGLGIGTQQDLDEGRLIVELRVAPSLPMRFLTVRLTQIGERLSVSEGA